MKKLIPIALTTLLLTACGGGDEEEASNPGEELVDVTQTDDGGEQEDSEQTKPNPEEEVAEEQTGPREIDISLLDRNVLNERAKEEKEQIEEMNEEMSGENVEDSFELYDTEESEDGEPMDDEEVSKQLEGKTEEEDSASAKTREESASDRQTFMDKSVDEFGVLELGEFKTSPDSTDEVAVNLVLLSEALYPVSQDAVKITDISEDSLNQYFNFVKEYVVDIPEDIDMEGFKELIKEDPAKFMVTANIDSETHRLTKNVETEDSPAYMLELDNNTIYRLIFNVSGENPKFTVAQGM